MINKKGALELSLNTIVVVVIAILILTLGVVFIKNTMFKIGELTKMTFEQADAELRQMYEGDEDVTLGIYPKIISVSSKDYSDSAVWAVNKQDQEKSCKIKFLDGKNYIELPLIEIDSNKLSPGQGETLLFRVKAKTNMPFNKELPVKIQSDCGENGNYFTYFYIKRTEKKWYEF